MHNVGFHANKPALFVLCSDNADVQDALKFATRHGLPVSVRSKGHSACGSSIKSDSMVIDLANINHCDYDAKTTELTVGPGCTLSDVGVHLMRHNRMTPSKQCVVRFIYS